MNRDTPENAERGLSEASTSGFSRVLRFQRCFILLPMRNTANLLAIPRIGWQSLCLLQLHLWTHVTPALLCCDRPPGTLEGVLQICDSRAL